MRSSFLGSLSYRLSTALAVGSVLLGGAGNAAEPHNPLITGEQPQYVFFWKVNWQPHPLTAEYCNAIKQEVGTSGHSKLRVGVSITFDLQNHTAEEMVGWLHDAFEASETTDVPLLINLDGQNYWENSPELWNWWDPNMEGYDPNNVNNVEWSGWGPEYATKVAWRDWGALHRIPPAPNLASPAFLQAHWEKYDALVPVIAAWYDSLPQNKKYLFGGVKVGWECTIIPNAMYWPNGNAIYDANPGYGSGFNDPISDYGLQHGWTIGAAKTGYAAATTSGVRTSGTLTQADHETIIGGYLTALSREVHERGIPRHLIFTHQGSWDIYAYEAGMNEYSIPGYSFYHHAPPESQLGAALDGTGRTQYANVETFWWENSKEAYRARFEQTLNPFAKGAAKQCRNVVIYAWALLENDAQMRTDMTTALAELIADTQPPPDSDGDYLSDDDEINVYGTDPNSADTDNDGINDGDEVLETFPYPLITNPLLGDTDGDGVSDYLETEFETDPNNATDTPNLPVQSRFGLMVLCLLLAAAATACLFARKTKQVRI